ncbi:MAG: helix-turn-helix transcriptional regulator [Phycisphaerales bacterium]
MPTDPATPALKQDHAELVVLSVLRDEAQYGYAISRLVQARSGGAFRLTPGVLYPLLTRLEKQGLVTTEWEEVKADQSEPDADGRRRKWYRLSAKGEKRLAARIEAHRRFTRLIDSFIVGGAGGEGAEAEPIA